MNPDVEQPQRPAAQRRQHRTGVAYREVSADGTPALWVEPDGVDPAAVVFLVHGSPAAPGPLAGHLARAAGTRALVVTPGPPEPLDGVVRAYEWLLGQGVEPARTAAGGESLGGWLAVSLCLRARDRGLPLPAALVLISAWTGLEDGAFRHTPPLVDALAAVFLADVVPADERLDLMRAEFAGLPPILLQPGEGIAATAAWLRPRLAG